MRSDLFLPFMKIICCVLHSICRNHGKCPAHCLAAVQVLVGQVSTVWGTQRRKKCGAARLPGCVPAVLAQRDVPGVLSKARSVWTLTGMAAGRKKKEVTVCWSVSAAAKLIQYFLLLLLSLKFWSVPCGVWEALEVINHFLFSCLLPCHPNTWNQVCLRASS